MKLLRLYRDSFSGLPPQVWLLALVMLINRSGAMVVPFLSIYMSKELGFSYTQVGWVMASFGLGSFFGNYIGGRLVDRFGQYYQQIFSLVATGTIFYILSLFHTYEAMLLGVFGLSFMADLFRPANLAAMSIYSDFKQITRSVSLNRLAMNLGFTVGPSIAGWLAVSYGYKWIFYVDTASCFLAAIIFFSFLKRREIQRDPEKQKALGGAILKNDPWYGAFLITVLLSGIGFVSLFTSYPVFMEEKLQMTEGVIGIWLAVNGFIIFLTEMPIVYYLESRNNTYNPIVVGMALISFALIGSVGLFPTLLMVGIYFVLITFGEILAFPFQATFSLNRASNEQKGTYMGYYGLTWSIALMVGPPTSFWVAEKLGFYYLWAILGAVTLLSSLFMFFLKKRLIKS